MNPEDFLLHRKDEFLLLHEVADPQVLAFFLLKDKTFCIKKRQNVFADQHLKQKVFTCSMNSCLNGPPSKLLGGVSRGIDLSLR